MASALAAFLLRRASGPARQAHAGLVRLVDMRSLASGMGGADPASPAARLGAHARVPRQADLPTLAGAVIAATKGAVGGDVRLFLEGSKEELTPAACGKQLAAAAGTDRSGLVVLLATAAGAPLSSAATARPPLAPVPRGPAPWPIVKNLPLLLRGPGDVPQVGAGGGADACW